MIHIYYNRKIQAKRLYKTLPSKLTPNRKLVMINAGDSGTTKSAVNLTGIAATLKPDVFILGGDIAYDDNL